MTIEEVYAKLKSIKNQAANMTEDSFDKTRAFKFVYNNILDIIDSLEYLEEQEDLFDDDDDWSNAHYSQSDIEIDYEKDDCNILKVEDLI